MQRDLTEIKSLAAEYRDKAKEAAKQGCIKPPSSIRHSGGLNDYSGHSLAPGISSADA
jgi:hypothetical protein